MRMSTPVRPNVLCFPIGVTTDDQQASAGGEIDDTADPKMALMDDPIVGMDRVTYD